jgi:hypothetical protein
MPRIVPTLPALAVALVLALFPASPARAGQAAPSEIAGMRLGANAEDLRDRLDLSRLAPLWDRPWLIRANLKPTKGFAAGYVLLGGCATANRVERVRLQYKDGSKAQYEKLAAALTARYGKPTPVVSGKSGPAKSLRWIFGQDKANGVDILLEHYDNAGEDSPSGNIIRLTDNRALAQERSCHDTMLRGSPEPQPAFPLFEVDDTWLLPK